MKYDSRALKLRWQTPNSYDEFYKIPLDSQVINLFSISIIPYFYNILLQIAETKRMSLQNSTALKQLVTVPYWQPASALTWFMTWIQPCIALLGVVDNAVVVLIIGILPGKKLAAVTRTSRIYYVVISTSELGVLVIGYLIRQNIPVLSFLVFLLF